MRSCVVFSTPRSGTHLIMRALRIAGMEEEKPLTGDLWRRDPLSVFDMPLEDSFRFGAHVYSDDLRDTFLESGLRGIYIRRDIGAQIRSYIAYKAIVRNVVLGDEQALAEVRESLHYNNKWGELDGVLKIQFEDVDWKAISKHLGGKVEACGFPDRGDPYYMNTVPSRQYYGKKHGH